MPRVAKEALFACGAIGLALLFIIQSRHLTISAALLPRILAGCIILLSCLMTLNALRAHKALQAAGETENAEPIDHKLVCIYLVFIIIYVSLVEPLGYFIATPLFILGTYRYLRAVSVAYALAIAAGFSILVYGLFVTLLHLPVPMGLLEPLLEG